MDFSLNELGIEAHINASYTLRLIDVAKRSRMEFFFVYLKKSEGSGNAGLFSWVGSWR